MHVNRIAAEADAASDPLAAEMFDVLEQERARSGEQSGFIYVAGSAPRLGDGDRATQKLRAYLLTKIGMFPDLLQMLSAEHLARGDQTAASVASARAAAPDIQRCDGCNVRNDRKRSAGHGSGRTERRVP